MKKFALLGEKLAHSLSPQLHKAIYRHLEIDDASYRTIELDSSRLKAFFTGFRVGGFDGVNVTIPYKAEIIPFLDEVDCKAAAIEAVNCVSRTGNRLVGFNTDIMGFAYQLQQESFDIEGKSILLFGAGGSAKAVSAVLVDGKAAQIYIVNRTLGHAEHLLKTIHAMNPNVLVELVDEQFLAKHSFEFDAVVNTTSFGMFPETSSAPLSDKTAKKIFNANNIAIDLVYNPAETTFMKMASKYGASVANGMPMLVAQAVYSVEIWMGGNIVAHLEMKNLVKEMEKILL